MMPAVSGFVWASVFDAGSLSTERKQRLAGVGWRAGKHALLAAGANQQKQCKEAGRGLDVRYWRAGRFADKPAHLRQGAFRNHPDAKDFSPRRRDREATFEIRLRDQ